MSNRKSVERCDYIFKFVILGDSAVGKTNLLLRFTDADYKPSHIPTIGVDFKIKIMPIDGKTVKMQLWDTAGQQRFKTITETYYKGASGIVLVMFPLIKVYSVSDRKSFTNITSWMGQIQQRQEENTPKIIVGNKCDVLEKERCVTTEEGKQLAQKYGVQFLETSARTGYNVNNLFEILGRLVMQRAAVEQQKQQSTMKSQLSRRQLTEKKKQRFDCCQS